MDEPESRESPLKRIEKKLPWGLMGVIATLVVGLPAIYLAVREPTPCATIEILSISNVFDVYRPLPELTVFFRGKDIQKSGQNIRVVTLAITNTGSKNIVQGDYDQDLKFGFTFPNGLIVGAPRLLHADSKYLKDNLLVGPLNDSGVELKKVILEKGQSATFELLVLQDRDTSLVVLPLGKISGQRAIWVRDMREAGKPTGLELVFQGGFSVNLLRFIFMSLLFCILIVVAIWGSFLEGKLDERSNRKRVSEYLAPVLDSAAPELRDAVRRLVTMEHGQMKRIDATIAFLESPDAAKLLVDAAEEVKQFRSERTAVFSVSSRDQAQNLQLIIGPAEPPLVVSGGARPEVNRKYVELLSAVRDHFRNSPPPRKVRLALAKAKTPPMIYLG